MNARAPAFGAVLRRFREAAGWSQELLAEQSGISLRGISDLERGARTTPRLETVRLLADGLGLNDADRATLFAARSAAGPAMSPEIAWTARLPKPSTAFFGREAELAMLRDLLASRESRLVTLLGPGGVGKTRLAIEIARRLGDAFPDGVMFVGLASVKDEALVLPTVAAALGVPDTGNAPLMDRLVETLRDRAVLLLIDNLEQVVNASPEIAALLERCPSLTALVTSRVVLHLSAETVIPVSPLGVPEDAGEARVEVLAGSDAVALFADRARAVDPAFHLDDGNIGVVVELVRRLDGIPLAIELAAARTGILPLEVLAARLDRQLPQLPMLTGGRRDMPERQQTMRNAISWSYELLGPKEQAIFRRLSIFRSGCTLEAAEKVLGTSGDLGDLDILDGLAGLVDSSLLRRRMVAGSPPRFLMLATVREFGLEQLAAHGEEEATREAAYRSWYRELSYKAEPHSGPEGEIEWLELLEREHDNFRSALSWLISRDRIQDALELSGALWFFRWIRGHYAEATDQYEELLRHPLGLAPTFPRARALIGLGLISLYQGKSERSVAAVSEAIDILRAGGHDAVLAHALLCLGNTYLHTGRLDDAEASLRESHGIAIESGADALEVAVILVLGIIMDRRGRPDEARQLLTRQVDLARALNEQWGLSLGLLYLGMLSMQDGDLDRAEAQVEEATRLIIAFKDRKDLPDAYWTLAEIAGRRGDLEKAATLMQQALGIAREIGDSLMAYRCLSGMARIAFLAGDAEAAMEMIRDAAEGFRSMGDELTAVGCLDLVVDIAIATGDHAHAAWCTGAVDGIYEARGVTRRDGFPREHMTRVATLVEVLGEHGWREHWSAGYGQDVDAALGIGLEWCPTAAIDRVKEDEEALTIADPGRIEAQPGNGQDATLKREAFSSERRMSSRRADSSTSDRRLM